MDDLLKPQKQAELFTGPEAGPALALFDSDGRDELNLAEFPLAALSTRTAEGVKTLEFSDRIFDKSTGLTIERKLTVTAADKFGLPNAVDDEIILALIQLSKKQGFSSRTVPFSRYEIIRILGWENQTWSYRRILQALDRWTGVTLKYENAWWDRDKKRWTNETFHIIDRLTDVMDGDGTERAAFVWSEVIFNSLQKGHLKPLDLAIYRQLQHPAAKRLYRLLDKRFYYRHRVEFDLLELAFHKLGIAKFYEIGKIKQRLQPAIEELENVGFIARATAQQRYQKHGVKKWNIIFEKADGSPSAVSLKGSPVPKPSEIEALLIEMGVTAKKASRLAATQPEEYIRHRVDELRHLLKEGKTKIANPAGWLVKAIEENYASPKDYKTPQEREREEAAQNALKEEKARKEREAEAQKRREEEVAATQIQARKTRVEVYLGTLSDEDRANLVSDAIQEAKAKGTTLLGLREGPFLQMMRETIIQDYVLSILEAQK